MKILNTTYEGIVDHVLAVFEEILAEDGVREPINVTTPLARLETLDSLDFIEIVMAMEENYQVDLYDEEIEKLLTIGGLVELIQKALDRKKA